jgi:hypothetical protein
MMTVDTSGPIFDGRARRVLDKLETEMTETVADKALTEVTHRLAEVLKNPTGTYVSRLQVERAGEDRKVTDGGVVYGPWLAGVSSRNQTSRFKGYTHWRRATQTAQSKVDEWTRMVVERRVRELE